MSVSVPVLELEVESFRSEVIDASNSKLVVVDFFATWCGPCKSFAPILAAVAAGMDSNSVKFCKFDIDKTDNGVEIENPSVLYKIMSVPTTVFFKGGREVGRFSGSLSLDAFKSKVLSFL